MHKDYAREVYYKLKNQKHVEAKTDFEIIFALLSDEVIDFAYLVGDEKIQSICTTMRNSYGYKYNPKSSKKITDKQKNCVAIFLMEKYLTAREILKHAFSISEHEFDLTEKEISYL